MKSMICFVVAGAIVCGGTAFAGQAVGWRTDGTGTYPDAKPPTEWGPEKNVVWSTPAPDWSNGIPVIWGDRIFITAEPDTLICVNKADGKIRWQKSNSREGFLSEAEKPKIRQAAEIDAELQPLVGKLNALDRELKKLRAAEDKDEAKIAALEKQKADLKPQIERIRGKLEPLAKYVVPKTHNVNGYTSATPTTDGRYVCVVFGTAVAACYDMDGQRKWIRTVDHPANAGWGHSTSPLLVGDKLLVNMKDLVALDVKTGKEIWRTKVRDAFGTPACVKIGDEEVIVTPPGEFIRLRDGEILGTVDARLEYNSPLIVGDVAYFVATSKGAAMAVRLPKKAEKFDPEMIWKTDKLHPKRYYASPVYREGLLYALSQDSRLVVLNASDGSIIHMRALKGFGETAFPSLSLAGGRLVAACDKGVMAVLEPGRECKVIAKSKLDTLRSTPVFEGDRMYVRTYKTLYCFGR